MYQEIFTKLGLTPNEAIIYEYLLRNGESTAGAVIQNTALQRGAAYNTLSELVSKGLATQRIKEKVTRFSATHPEKIRDFMEEKEKEIYRAKKSFEANWGSILSDFNLHSQKPGVQYFEGLKGVKKVLWDSLEAKTEILTYLDTECTMKGLTEINKEYVEERKKRNVFKKILTFDSPFTIEYMKKNNQFEVIEGDLTKTKIIGRSKIPINTIMQIYNNKVSYITFSDNNQIGVIIENQYIAQMHNAVYKIEWEKAKTLKQILEGDSV